MSVTNPFTYYVTSNTTKSFTYTAGHIPFNVTFKSKGHIPFNVIMFGLSSLDIWENLKDLVKFRKECLKEYIANANGEYVPDLQPFWALLEDTLNYNDVPSYKLTIEAFTPLHAIKVAWADNDIIG